MPQPLLNRLTGWLRGLRGRAAADVPPRPEPPPAADVPADPAQHALQALRFPGIAALQARLGAPVVVADFEMNGYNDAHRTRFIEFAAMTFDAEGRARIDSSLVGSELPVFWPATKKTGLRTQDVRGAPPWERFAPRFEQIARTSVLALYAAAFDVIALTEEQARVGHPIDGPRVLDVQVLARQALGVPQAPSLSRACEAFGVAFSGTAHRAGGDTLTTALLLERLIARGGLDTAAALPVRMDRCHRVAPDEAAVALLTSDGARSRSAGDLARQLQVPPARVRAWQVALGLAAAPTAPRRRARRQAGVKQPGAVKREPVAKR